MLSRMLSKNIITSKLFLKSGKRMEKEHRIFRFGALFWRRVRDLNPGYAHHVHTISSRAPSTTQPTLHFNQHSSEAFSSIVYFTVIVKHFSKDFQDNNI